MPPLHRELRSCSGRFDWPLLPRRFSGERLLNRFSLGTLGPMGETVLGDHHIWAAAALS
jgi:hypothetical protein